MARRVLFTRRMRMLVCALLLAAPLGACSSKKNDPPAADNTAKNRRDSDKVPTADQGAQSGTDLDLTAKIRRGFMDADGLSTNAQNAKIVVKDGVVTLVGPVASAEEGTRLEGIATSAGATNVINQLEIAK